jgi:hypothetical protein
MVSENWIEKSHDSWSVFKIMGELVEGYEKLSHVSIEFLLGLHELVVKYAFLKINPFFANASIFGVITSLFP